MNEKLFQPLKGIEWVKWELLKPNDYNPNKVSKDNLELLTLSIFVNGFTAPVVCRPDRTIIDGFHRYMVFGPEWKYAPSLTNDEWTALGYDTTRKTLYERSQGTVPIVTVSQVDESMYIYGTVTHNRARGQHLLEPMKAIVKRLIDEGKTIKEIGKQLGMKPEEVFRLSDFSREDFLEMMTKDVDGYSRATVMRNI